MLGNGFLDRTLKAQATKEVITLSKCKILCFKGSYQDNKIWENTCKSYPGLISRIFKKLL